MSAEVTLGWNNAQLQAGARAATSIVQRSTNQMNSMLKGVGKIDIGGVLGGAGVLATLISMGKKGFEFNQIMGDSEIAIAQVLRQFQGLNQEAAKKEAAAAMAAMVELEPKTSASLTGLVDGFLATLGASQSAGISVAQNIDLVGKFANALSNARLPAEQIAQEMRSIVTGNIGADSQLAKMLQISNADITRAREAGKLYEFLNDKVGILGEAGDSAGVAFSSLNSSIDKSLGLLHAGMFDDAVSASKKLTVVLEANAGGFKLMGQQAGQMLTVAAESFKGFIAIGGGMAAAMDKINSEKSFNLLKGPAIGIPGMMASLKTLYTPSAKPSFYEEMHRQMEKMNELEKKAEKTKDKTDEAGSKKTGGGTGNSAAQDSKETAREHAQIESMRVALAERQFEIFMSHLPPLMQIEAIQKRIQDLQAQAAGRDGPMQEQERLTIQGQILDFQEKERNVRKDIADSAARAKADAEEKSRKASEEAEKAAEIAASRQQELALLNAELDIIQARNAGDEKRAQALERVKKIAEETLRIMDATGLSQDTAMQKATALVDGQDPTQQANRQPGDRIQGYSREQQGGADEARNRAGERYENARSRISQSYKNNFGGLDEFNREKNTPLRDSFKFPGLDAYREMQNRQRPIGAQTPASNAKPVAAEMPTLEGLMKQLITVTIDLKES